MPRKDLLDIASLDRAEIDHLLDQSVPFKELFTRSVKKVPALKGKSVLMLFYEPSTRTHSSFEVAAKRLSADVTNFDVAQSSITKGESVRETIETLQAMRTDFVIVRHKASGLPGTIARLTRASVVNAGDGAHAHPTQALLDAFTIKEKFRRLEEIRDRGLYIMHPGPVNRGVELCDAVMDYERSLINDQVENGIAVRMAVLYWLKPGSSI